MSDNIQRNNELYFAVSVGDAAARKAMILNNLGLVVIKADALIRTMPGVAYLRDDLVSAGNVGLVRAVYKITPQVRREAVNNWIGRQITEGMLALLPHEHTIYIPRMSAYDARRQNRPIIPPRVRNGLSEKLETYREFETVDLRDLMDACCQSHVERECLRLREQGHTFKAIGSALGIPLPTAHLIFRRLKARILHRWTHSARPSATANWQYKF